MKESINDNNLKSHSGIEKAKNNHENNLDPINNEDVTSELILFAELYNTCEQAYEDGVNSVDIYKILHSPDLIKQALKEARHSVEESKRRKKPKFVQLFLTFNSFLFNFALFTLISFLSYLLICHCMDVSPLFHFPSIMDKRCLLPTHPVLLEMARPIANCSVCGASNLSPVIEFKSLPSEEEFHAVVYSSRPIIIRGGAFRTDINFAKLKAIFESEPDGIDSVADECQFLPFRSPFATLREAFDTISDTNESTYCPFTSMGNSEKCSRSETAQPWYIGWSNCNPAVAAKLREMFPRPNFLPKDSEASTIDWIFIGSPGLGAAMHIDYVRRPSWQAQLSGEKKWILKPPPECESQCPKSISFVIHPGDMLFVETNIWYHETFILGSNLSISIGSEYD